MDTLKAGVPVIALIVAISAFIVACIVGFRSRNIFRPTYQVRFGILSRNPREFRRRVGDALPDAVLFTNAESHRLRNVYLPVSVENTSMRKISDVIIDITLPVAYLTTNADGIRAMEGAAQAFPEHRDRATALRQALQKYRETNEWGGRGHIRYRLGTLNPGQKAGLFEPIAIPSDRGVAFTDKRFQGSAFDKVLSILSEQDQIDGLCRIEMTIYADLVKKREFAVNLVICHGQPEREDWPAMREYVRAHWLGEFPAGKRFFRPHIPFFEFLLPPLIKEKLVLLQRVSTISRVSDPKNGHVTVITESDPFEDDYGMATLFMPGYNVFELPDEIADAASALGRIGFVSAGELKSRIFDIRRGARAKPK